MYRVFAEYIKDATPERGQFKVLDYYEDGYHLSGRAVAVCHPIGLALKIKAKTERILAFSISRKPRIGAYISPYKEIFNRG